MRTRFIGVLTAFAVIVVCTAAVLAQGRGGGGGQATPQDQRSQQGVGFGGFGIPCSNTWQLPLTDACRPRAGKLNPHDLSGVWLRTGGPSNMGDSGTKLLTALGKKLFAANKSATGSSPVKGSLSNDPLFTCDPLGLTGDLWAVAPRAFEFVPTPDRILQFFEWQHQFRTVWIDGRQLPKNPDPRWEGYSVGRWEGDTFVVDTIGFDDRSWVDRWGHPHSTEMRVQERYRRPTPDKLEMRITITDPKIYMQPWVSDATIHTLQLEKGMDERLETYCVPSEEQAYIKEQLNPAEGISK
jgi:hypothetical protein